MSKKKAAKKTVATESAKSQAAVKIEPGSKPIIRAIRVTQVILDAANRIRGPCLRSSRSPQCIAAAGSSSRTRAIFALDSEPRIPGQTSQRVAEFRSNLGLQTYGFLRKVTLDSFMPGGRATGRRPNMGSKTRIKKGDRVRDAKWSGKFTGTVVRVATSKGRRVIFVQWDNIAVEDKLLEAEVTAMGTRVEGEIPTVVKAVEIGWRS